MTALVFLVALTVGGVLAGRPLLRAPARWPADPPDERDDVARAASSLRDLDEARAGGTLDAAEHARLRALIERDARVRSRTADRGRAPVRSVVIAALLAGIAVIAAVATLPREAGDRAPGVPITGSVPARSSIAELEARAVASPRDVPTLLALAEAYRGEGRAGDAARTYQRALEVDGNNVAALDGLGLLLYQAGERDAAMLAIDRALTLRPRDADALFLKGLAAYEKGEWRVAVDAWSIYLDVGEFDPAAPMVRPLYERARTQLGAK